LAAAVVVGAGSGSRDGATGTVVAGATAAVVAGASVAVVEGMG